MLPWSDLNFNGKCLVLCAVLNIILAVTIARSGSYVALIPALTAMVCGLATYCKKYQKTFYIIDNERKTK